MNNRTIKFRIWDRELGIFENYADSKTGYLEEILIHPKGILVVKNTIALTVLDENRYVAQQFTGLKDSTGKEIYEGDIVECNDGLKGRIYGEVVYDQEYGAFRIAFTDILQWTFYRAENPEVIGNIFENPELLA